MGHRRKLSTVALLVLSVATFHIAGCDSGPARLSKLEAVDRLNEANKLEKQLKLELAFRLYKEVDVLYETNDAVRAAGWDGAQRIRLLAKTAEREINLALTDYFSKNGTYPDTLDSIKPKLSPAAVEVFAAFTYTKKDKGTILLTNAIN